MDRKNTIIVIFIFISALLWGLFLTYGIPFFWEDMLYYHLDKAEYPLGAETPSNLFSVITIIGHFIKEFFTSHRLFQAGFGNNFIDRPYQFLAYDLMRTIFTDNIIFYRIFKSAIFAINACCIFLIIKQASGFLAFLGMSLYLVSAEIWTMLAYSTDVGLYTQCGMFLCMILFFRLMGERPLQNKIRWFYYFLIIVISSCTVLSKGGEGRELAIIFCLYILLFCKNKFIFHLPLLTILFLTEIPVLGYIKNVFTGFAVSPINIAGHNARPLPLPAILKSIIKNNIYPRYAIGNLLLLALGIVIMAHLLCMVIRKNGIAIKQAKSDLLLKKRLFVAMAWFLFTLTGMAISRGFNYTGLSDWTLALEASYFFGPFIIFLCCYIAFVSNRIRKPYGNIFLLLCACLIISEIVVVKLPRLNHFRGAWGGYFVALSNAEKYIDGVSDNALVLATTKMQYKPFVFRNSNNEVINSLIVKEENFAEVINNPKGLFLDLVKNGYIDKDGIIENKFREVKDESDMTLADKYIKDREKIYKILSKNYAIVANNVSPFCDLRYIENKFRQTGRKEIFVIGHGELKFKGKSQNVILKETKGINGDAKDLYDTLKRFTGRPFPEIIYVYRFSLKNIEN